MSRSFYETEFLSGCSNSLSCGLASVFAIGSSVAVVKFWVVDITVFTALGGSRGANNPVGSCPECSRINSLLLAFGFLCGCERIVF